MKSLKILIVIFVFIIPIFLASAHSLFLFNISLDFDKDLKSNVTKTAQKAFGIDKEPVSFDLDNGLIIAHFEPDQRKYAEINPLGYNVQGIHNEDLRHNNGSKTLTKEQGFLIAKKSFDSLPSNLKSELEYGNDVSEADDTYFYKWFRKVNGLLVVSEDFMVNIDAVNHNIIAWRLGIFEYPKEEIETIPAISGNVAKKVAELTFNAPSSKDFKLYLVIYKNEPVWIAKLQGQFYPFYAGVSARDGSIVFNGLIPGEVPGNYSAGDRMPVVENDIIKKIYGSN